jgi:glycosyltransferase involved in cell wall biosynthesis
MRIGLVVYDGLDGTSGGYLYDRRVVAGLRDRGHEVEVVGIPREEYRTNLLDDGDPAVADALAALDVDVCLQDELCHPSLLGYNRRGTVDAPVVPVVHHLRCSEPWPARRRRLYRAVERRYLAGADGFVFNSRTTRRTVEDLVGPTDGVVAVPGRDHVDPAVTDDEVVDRAAEPGPIRVAFVGSVDERKGVHTLLRGLAGLPDGEWSLTLVGDRGVDPDYAARVDGLVESLGVGDAVTVAGRLPEAELAATLRGSHVLAIPSAYEGYGIAYLEGMGYGLPAVASAAGGAREVVADGETGFLVPPDDPDAVASAVGTLADDRDRLAEMGVAARRRFEAHPTWDDAAETVEAYLREF